MSYLVTIGLEVHCQVKTQTKMFCACRTSFGDTPNTNTCPVCLGLPGALPVLNREAIEKTLLTGLMPARNGAENNHTYKRDGVASLPETLRALGYDERFLRLVGGGHDDRNALLRGNGLGGALGLGLERQRAAAQADDGQARRVEFLIPTLIMRQVSDAVDAAKGPEVNHNHFSPQLTQGERFRVDPG